MILVIFANFWIGNYPNCSLDNNALFRAVEKYSIFVIFLFLKSHKIIVKFKFSLNNYLCYLWISSFILRILSIIQGLCVLSIEMKIWFSTFQCYFLFILIVFFIKFTFEQVNHILSLLKSQTHHKFIETYQYLLYF